MFFPSSSFIGSRQLSQFRVPDVKKRGGVGRKEVKHINANAAGESGSSRWRLQPGERKINSSKAEGGGQVVNLFCGVIFEGAGKHDTRLFMHHTICRG